MNAAPLRATVLATATMAQVVPPPCDAQVVPPPFTEYELWLKSRIEAPPQMYQWLDEKYICEKITGYSPSRIRNFYINCIIKRDEFAGKFVIAKAIDIWRGRRRIHSCETACNCHHVDWKSIPEFVLQAALHEKRFLFLNPEGFKLLHINSRKARGAFSTFYMKYESL